MTLRTGDPPGPTTHGGIVELFSQPGIVISLCSSGVAFCAWLIRLEAKLKSHDEIDTLRFDNLTIRQNKIQTEFAELKDRQSRVEERIFDKLAVIEKSLSKIEGQLTIVERSQK